MTFLQKNVMLTRFLRINRSFARQFVVGAVLPWIAFSQIHIRDTVKLPLVDGDDIRFRRMSADSGLSQTRVGQIVQDDRGFMWFGTAYGLNRFDGYSFTVFAHDRQRPGSLAGVQITALFKDHAGVLWVGCNHMLDRYNPVDETFTHYKLETLDRDNAPVTIFNISETDNGMLWLSTRNGLYRFEPATGSVKHYTHDPKNSDTIGGDQIISTALDRDGVLWVGHQTGLDRFDRASGKVTLHIPLERSRTLFHEDRQGRFWIIYGVDNTLATLDRNGGALTLYPMECDGLSDTKLDSVLGMFEDRDGVMWFSTRRNGLVKFDRPRNRFIRYRNHLNDTSSLAADRLSTIFQDREGNFWIGLDEAPPNFFLSRPPLFEDLTQVTPAVSGSARRMVVFKDSRGTVWLGSEKALWRLHPNARQDAEPDSTLSSVVSIAEQGTDTLWMAGNFRGVIRMNPSSGETNVYRPNPSDPHALNTNQIERIVIARNGTPWFATWNGLAKFDSGRDRFTTYRNPFGSTYHSLTEDVSGKFWLGSEQGLQEFDPASERFATYGSDTRNPRTISDNRVNSVFFDHAGVIWTGTQNGLGRFDKQSRTFTSYFEQDGLAGNLVSCILEDDRDFLWMSTNRGVSRLDPDRKTFTNYGVADGLPGLDLTGWGTCHKSADGEMFFSGYSGAVSFHPNQTNTNGPPPQVSLTGFRLFGTEVNGTSGSPLKQSIVTSSAITLAHWQNFFSFEFAALSFYSPSSTRYRYRLQGVDPQWIEVPGSRREANYTSIAPGVYTFQVQGATSRGPWSEPGVSLRIEVMPPWWSTLWFRLTDLMAAMIVVFWLYWMRVSHITGRLGVRFEERLAERARIARELHDTLLQSFHGLLFRFQTARNLLPYQAEGAIRVLDSAINKAELALEEGRDAVQNLRSEISPQSDLEDLLIRATGELTAAQDRNVESATFLLTVEGTKRTLSPVLRDEVYRVAHELLRNAFTHARAQHIETEIRYEDRALRLRIRDDGTGIGPGILRDGGLAGHWGLPGVRERAQQIGGRLEFWSETGAGTEVELSIPGPIAYAKSPNGLRPNLRLRFFRGIWKNL